MRLPEGDGEIEPAVGGGADPEAEAVTAGWVSLVLDLDARGLEPVDEGVDARHGYGVVVGRNGDEVRRQRLRGLDLLGWCVCVHDHRGWVEAVGRSTVGSVRCPGGHDHAA